MRCRKYLLTCLDQSTLQIINVVRRRGRQKPRRVFLPQGFDIPLMWVPKGHVARASAVLGGTLTGCGPFESFLSTGNSSEFCDHK